MTDEKPSSRAAERRSLREKPQRAITAGKADSAPHYLGHRERLRARFGEAPDQIPDYELLELLLFRSIPRADVKGLAKALIARFGSFAETLAASPQLLAEIKGVGPAIIHDLKLVEASARRMSQGAIRGRQVLGSWASVLEYCHTAMAFAEVEELRVLFLDKKNGLIKDEMMQRGTVDHTPVYPREIMRRAIQLNASAVILVHNHPSGDPAPSRADIDMTREIVEHAEAVGITIHDHLIVGRKGHASFRALGLL